MNLHYEKVKTQEEKQEANQSFDPTITAVDARTNRLGLRVALVLGLLLLCSFLVSFLKVSTIKTTRDMKEYLSTAINNLEASKKFADIQLVQPFQELPFCVVLTANQASMNDLIAKSIETGYANLRVVFPKTLSPNEPKYDYYFYRKLIAEQCKPKSLVLFANHKLKIETIKLLNKYHQTYDAWLTYQFDNSTGVVSIISFYSRVFELIGENDFDHLNDKFLQLDIQPNPSALAQDGVGDPKQHIILALLELCRFHNKDLSEDLLLGLKSNAQFTREWLSSGLKEESRSSSKVMRGAYQPMILFNQDYKLSSAELKNLVYRRLKVRTEIDQEEDEIKWASIMKATDYLQLVYLPKEHSLFERERISIEKQFSVPERQNEEPFCVTILSHNNIENGRYKKVIDSIVQQEYRNYHIVFIDDSSNDDTLNKTGEYLKSIGFPLSRVTLVQNLDRNYATYNIINAAFQFCKSNDIQVLVDGDDELIGTQAFRLINHEYSADGPEHWVVYTSYMTSSFDKGLTHELRAQNMKNRLGNRVISHYITPIRSWRVKLIRKIPKDQHQDKDGQWLTTLYDDALQHPLFELAGKSRIKFTNCVNYFYNDNYGQNDSSSLYKLISRAFLLVFDILDKKPLALLATLDGPDNEQVQQILNRQKNVKYRQISIHENRA